MVLQISPRWSSMWGLVAGDFRALPPAAPPLSSKPKHLAILNPNTLPVSEEKEEDEEEEEEGEEK